MSDLLFWGASLASAVIASAVSAIGARAATRAPLLARISELDEQHAREAAATRRRQLDAARLHEQEVSRLRGALGLRAVADDEAPRGRALAEQLVERLHGLATVDRCIVADGEGLAWTSDDFAEAAGLGASAAAAMSATLHGARPRSVHVELGDARHIVVRPIPGTLPELALATLTTSRPASTFALDAILAYAALRSNVEDEMSGTNPLVGWPSHISRNDAPVTSTIARELEDASASIGAGAMALLIGDEIVAAFGTDGPQQGHLAPFATTLRDAVMKIEVRMGSSVRRIDWSSHGGATISLAPLGTSRRTWVLVVRRAGAVDGVAFDRLGGRLRRLVPAEAGATTSFEVRT